MLPIGKLAVIHPHQARAGTLLIANARYDRLPMLISGEGAGLGYVHLGKANEGAFKHQSVAQNMGPHIAVDSFEVFVDHTLRLSPTRVDIPLGCMVLDQNDAHLVVSAGYATTWLSLSGELKDEGGFDNVTAFPRWCLKTRIDDSWVDLLSIDVSEEQQS